MSPPPRPLLVAIAFVAFVSLGLPDAILGVAWPSMRRTFELSLSRLGEVIATSMAGYLLSSTLSGAIVTRAGVGRLLLGSTVLVTLGLAISASAPAWWVMLACGVLAGLGAGAIDAGINTFAAERFPPRFVTWLHACYGVGATLGPLAMTAVLSTGLSWRWGYALIGAALAIMSVVFLFTQGLWTLEPPHSVDGAASIVKAATITQTLRRPLVWAHIALFFLYTGLEVSAGQWLYSLLSESRRFSATLAGSCVGLYWGGLTAGRVAFGLAAPRFRATSVLRFAMVGAPVAALALWWGPAPELTAAAAILLGFMLAPIYPLLISETPARLGRQYAAHAIGFQVSAAYLGAATIAGLAGLLAKAYGLESICPFLLCASLALFLLHEVAVRFAK